MAKHVVNNVSEVNYMAMSDGELSKVYRLSDLKSQYVCTSFDQEGDRYVCFRDLDGNSDDRGYAVYLKSSGRLLCLLVDAGSALEGYEDFEYGAERDELYRQIAILAGWPESMSELRLGLTWRQFIAKLNDFPKEFLDTPAYVWRPDGGGMLATVRGVMPWFERYDGTVPGPGGEDDNCYFIDNGFPDEE